MKKIFILFCAAIILAGGVAAAKYLSYSQTEAAAQEAGDKVDELDGVAVYYNGRISNVSGRNTAPDGYNIGQKYQCVEFVTR